MQQYNSINLQQLDALNFIDRMDFKYTIAANKLEYVLETIKPFYDILEVGDYRYTDYKTNYFDTSDFEFYRKHHNGQSNRFKARTREYVQSKLFYIEVKYKNNKDWTSKYREKSNALFENALDKFKKLTQKNVEPKLLVQYRRITLVAKDASEKITMDVGLKYSANETTKDFGQLVIIEVKSKNRKRNRLRQLLKEMGYKEKGLSKYCFGITQMYDSVKINNFKPLIRDLNTQYEFADI